MISLDFPGSPVVKNLSCNAEDTSSILGWETKIPTCRQATSEPTRFRALVPQLERSCPEMKDPTCHN